MIICTDGLANKGVGTLDGKIVPQHTTVDQCMYTCVHVYMY